MKQGLVICKTTVQLLQNIHGVDITHDYVCSSMPVSFHMLQLLLTGRPISSFLDIFHEQELMLPGNVLDLLFIRDSRSSQTTSEEIKKTLVLLCNFH